MAVSRGGFRDRGVADAANEDGERCPTKDGGENASPARLQLKNKLYVVVNEVPGFDSSTLKGWCGGDQIVARGLYKDTEKFFGKFNLTAVHFQRHDPDQEGRGTRAPLLRHPVYGLQPLSGAAAAALPPALLARLAAGRLSAPAQPPPPPSAG